MKKAITENKVLKNHISGIVHMADSNATVCRDTLTVNSLSSGETIMDVYNSENIIMAYSKVTCKRCLRVMKKSYMVAFAQYQ